MLSTSKSIWAFDPKTVPGCCLWLDGNDPAGTGAQPSPGAAVSTWVDKSGSNNSLTAAGTAPTFSNTSPGSITFGGAGYYSKASPVFSNVYTAFFVYKQTAGNNGPLYTTSNTGGYSGFFANYNSFGTYLVIGDGGVGYWNTTTTTPFPFGTTQIATTSYASNAIGGAVSLYANGSNVVTTAQIGTISYTAFYLGRRGAASEILAGSMYEVMGFNYVLSATQRQQIEGYLAAKWGIKTSLQSTHPFYTFPPFLKPFSPLDLPGCALWLDGADRSSFDISGIIATTWYDKSGFNNTFTGYSTYTGSNLSFGGTPWSCSTPTPRIAAMTVFIIYKDTTTPKSTPYYYPVLDQASFSNFPRIGSIGVDGSASGVVGVNVSVYSAVSLTPNTSSLTDVLVSGVVVGSTSSWFVNGITADVITGGTLTSNAGFRSLGPYSFAGTISEVLVYNSPLTTNQRERVEGYLARKWGLTSQLVSTHPYKLIPPPTLTPLVAVSPGSCTLSGLTPRGGTITWGTSSTFADSYMWHIGTGSQTGMLLWGGSMDPTVFTVDFTMPLVGGTTYYAWVVPYSAGGKGTAAVSAGVSFAITATSPTLIAAISAASIWWDPVSFPGFGAPSQSVVVVFITTETDASDTTVGISSVTGLGLTWSQHFSSGVRKSYGAALYGYNTPPGCQKSEIWYAVNSSASPVSGTVSINQPGYFDAATVIVATFVGCNLTNPWLAGGDAVAFAADPDGGIWDEITMTLPAISVPNALALALTGGSTGYDDFGYTMGWTGIDNVVCDASMYYSRTAVAYQTFATTQGAQTISTGGYWPSWIYMTSVLVPP